MPAPVPREADPPPRSDAECGLRCVAAGGVLAALGLGGLASEAPAIVQLVSLCAFLASLLVWDFAFSTLLDDGGR